MKILRKRFNLLGPIRPITTNAGFSNIRSVLISGIGFLLCDLAHLHHSLCEESIINHFRFSPNKDVALLKGRPQV